MFKYSSPKGQKTTNSETIWIKLVSRLMSRRSPVVPVHRAKQPKATQKWSDTPPHVALV